MCIFKKTKIKKRGRMKLIYDNIYIYKLKSMLRENSVRF